MILVLLEDRNYYIKKFESTLKDVPKKSRIYVGRNNIDECLSLLKTKPLYTSKWFVFIDYRIKGDDLRKICSGSNFYVINTGNKKEFDDCMEFLSDNKFVFKTINNLVISEVDLIDYVLSNLSIKYDDAKYLVTRFRRYLPKIIDAVNILSILDRVSRDDIKNYTNPLGKVFISDLVESLLGISDKSKKKIVGFIYEFRYAYKYLFKEILKELDMYIWVFEQISLGILTTENCMDKSSNKEFDRIHKTKKIKMIDNYGKVSFDKVVLVKAIIEKIPRSKFSLLEIINLCN